MSVAGVEWTGAQQVSLFLQSGGLGLLFGVAFDVLEGVQPLVRRRRSVRWLLDILFGLLAAFVTFFVALGKMDGVLHPLLFGGILLGMGVEHIGIGRLVQRLTLLLCRVVARTVRLLNAAGGAATGFLYRIFRPKQPFWNLKFWKCQKSQKKSLFFSKKA
ncbi:MAG: spore cortex biosynthesis protein YabQ [Clostridia bacterium]|nr:spore cortex biosynthesis protein YabQ [Clostridia bacterium]